MNTKWIEKDVEKIHMDLKRRTGMQNVQYSELRVIQVDRCG